MIDTPFSAIPSWYGYMYQGHMAIYYIIKKMNLVIDKMMSQRKISIINDGLDYFIEGELSKYTFELEWMEDFAIKYNGKYISFHQVKASDENKFIDRSALFDVMFKVRKYGVHNDEAEHEIQPIGLFHVADSQVKIPDISSVQENLNNLFDELLKENENFLKLPDNELISELKDLKGRTKHSLKKLIFDKSKKENIAISNNSVDDVKELMLIIADEIKNSKFTCEEIKELLEKRVLIFEEQYSSLESIEKQIIQEIKIYYDKVDKLKGVINLNHIKEKVFPAFIQLIADQIDQRKKKDRCIETTFMEIVSILDKVKKPSSDIDYNTYIFRSRIADNLEKYIELYCESTYKHCIQCNNYYNCNLTALINDMNKIDNWQMKRLVSNITITRDIKKGLEQFPDHDCIHDTIFEFARNLKSVSLNKTRITTIKDNRVYWYTADNTMGSDKVFIKRLQDNRHNILDMIFEADNIVTKFRNIPKFDVNEGKIIELSDKDVQEISTDIRKKYIEDKVKIVNPKYMRVVDFESAKEELIDD